MGQKINPIGLRLGISGLGIPVGSPARTVCEAPPRGHPYPGCTDEGTEAGRCRAHRVERPHKNCRVSIPRRPGVVIGKKDADIDRRRRFRSHRPRGDQHHRNPQAGTRCDPRCRSIAQRRRRVAFRRAMKRAVQSAMRLGAEGIRINCSGRLGGAEITHGMVSRGPRAAACMRADVDWCRHRVHHVRHLRRQGLDLR